MERRIKDLINNIENVTITEKEKKSSLKEFTNILQSALTKMNDAIYQIGVDCRLSLLPEKELTKRIVINNNTSGKEIYSAEVNNDIQTLKLGYANEKDLKIYYISLNEGIELEDLYTKNTVDLEDVIMIDLKRIIEMNNF